MPICKAVSVTGTQTVAATAATVTASKVADLDFTDYNWSMALTVDGGSPQTLNLTTKFASADDLINALQAQTVGAAWSQAAGVVSVSSENAVATSGTISTTTTAVSGADLYIADGSGTTGTLATKAQIVGSTSADFDFSTAADKYTAMVSVDGGLYQTVVLSTNTTNITGLKAALNTQIVGATFTSSSNTLTLKSNSTGRQSSLVWRIVNKGSKDIKIAQTDPAVHGDNAVPTTSTGTQAADLNFRNMNYSASVDVDDAGVQAIALTSKYANSDALIADLNTQSMTTAFSDIGDDNILTITSSTTGTASEVSWTLVTPAFADADLGFVNGDTNGVAAITNHNATNLLLFAFGSAINPTEIEIFNNQTGTTPVLYVVNKGDTVVDNGMPIRPGASQTIPVETGDSVWVLTTPGDTVDTRVMQVR